MTPPSQQYTIQSFWAVTLKSDARLDVHLKERRLVREHQNWKLAVGIFWHVHTRRSAVGNFLTRHNGPEIAQCECAQKMPSANAHRKCPVRMPSANAQCECPVEFWHSARLCDQKALLRCNFFASHLFFALGSD